MISALIITVLVAIQDARDELQAAPINSVAWGNADGRIEAYQDVLEKLRAIESATAKAAVS